MSTNAIVYSKKGQVFRIHLNNPEGMNSLTIPQFVELGKLIDQADNDPETTVTLITSSGKFFSTGANIKFISKMTAKDKDYYLSEISAKNLYLVHLLLEHSKLLVVALNGPVIGLMASFVLLADLIYARTGSSEGCYMSFPFSNIKLTNEGGVSASLVARVGLSKAIETICLARKLKGKEMIRLGLINKVLHIESVDEFNRRLLGSLNDELEGLDRETVMQNKRFLKQQFAEDVKRQLVDETMAGLQKWAANDPQNAFREILKGTRKHKL